MKNQFGICRVVCVFIAVFLLTVMCGTAVLADEGNLHITVSDIYTSGDDQFVELEISNQAGARISFGWVRSCEILVTTDAGEFSFNPPSDEINQKSSTLVMKLPGCQGTIEVIEITDLRLLNHDGLPGKRLSNVVIYDVNNNIKSFVGSFPAGSQFSDMMAQASDMLDSMLGKNSSGSEKSVFDSVASSANTMMTVTVVVIVIIAAGAIIAAICISKSNKKSVQTFQPFAAPMQTDDAHQQAVNAHQQAMNAHQHAVDIHNQTMNDQFNHQCATTIMEGGFNPPPTPPVGF